jgi:hypothetical protein
LLPVPPGGRRGIPAVAPPRGLLAGAGEWGDGGTAPSRWLVDLLELEKPVAELVIRRSFGPVGLGRYLAGDG